VYGPLKGAVKERCQTDTHFTAYDRVSPEQLGAEDVHRYLYRLHLVEDLHFSPSNLDIHIAQSANCYAACLLAERMTRVQVEV
jgi:hypothetical protein